MATQTTTRLSMTACGSSEASFIRPFNEYHWKPFHFISLPLLMTKKMKVMIETKNANSKDVDSDSNDTDSVRSIGDDVPETSVYGVPTSRMGPEYFTGKPQDGVKQLVIVMVGLPARGKTFLAQKLCRLLGWNGHKAQVFNVQTLWREKLKRAALKSEKQSAKNTLAAALVLKPSPTEHLDSGNVNFLTLEANKTYNDTFKERYTASSSFDTFLKNTNSMERELYRQALEEHAHLAREFFEGGGVVCIVNDDFVTRSLRDDVENAFSLLANQLIYLEVQRDPENNVKFDYLKATDVSEYPPEMPTQESLSDFRRRVDLMEQSYETIRLQSNRSYIKLKNATILEAHDVRGYLPSRIVSFLMNLSQSMRVGYPLYFVRHGQSLYNIDDRLGGDPDLSEKGLNDAERLYEFVASLKTDLNENLTHSPNAQVYSGEDASGKPLLPPNHQNSFPVLSKRRHSSTKRNANRSDIFHPAPECVEISGEVISGFDTRSIITTPEIQLWTSQLKRTIQTAYSTEHRLHLKALRWASLNEIHAGICEGMTYDEVKKTYPLIHQFRGECKYTFRYPQGESYQDLIARLEPVITELENAGHVIIIVAHQAVLRALLAYFGGASAECCVNVEVPHRTVWRCTFNSKGLSRIDFVKLGKPAAGDGQHD